MPIVVASLLLVVLGAVALAVMPRATAPIGRLGHRTRRADRSDDVAAKPEPPDRPGPRVSNPPSPRIPPDDEALGITRRAFFNRSLLAGLGMAVGALGTASIAFLWAPTVSGFGGKINVGSVADADKAFADDEPLYSATAKTYIVPYPEADLARARKVEAYTAPILGGMERGYVALYQRCVHLGCRVPWCHSSQWFECPCHGSKYNRVGEKKAGPAPRGLDRFVFEVTGGNIIVDTGNLVLGPPIGTNTTGQTPEGPFCV
jgi:cytochrome b6-f complex iron-sulfur subunit